MLFTDAELTALEKIAAEKRLPVGTLVHELTARALRTRVAERLRGR